MQRHVRFVVPPAGGGAILVDLLSSRFAYHSRQEWNHLVLEGRVRVNGALSESHRVLAAGDVLEYLADDIAEPAVNRSVDIIWEDADIMVVNKPWNLPCHPAGRYFRHTLWAILREEHGVESPALINRLDRETSGLVVVARNKKSEKRCRALFARRCVEKRYVALVEGAFPHRVAASGYLEPDPDSPVRKKRRFRTLREGESSHAPGGAEVAITEFQSVARHGEISEVEVRALTGRRHQIRATLQALGYPVVGDKLYGGDPSIFIRFCQDRMTAEDWRQLRLNRQALHAAYLAFRHPRTGESVEVSAPLPSDLQDLIRAARRF